MKRLLIYLFLVSMPCSAATYYTSHNAGGGGAGTSGDPFTLQEAADTAAAADLVLVKATGTYSEGTAIDFDTNAGNDGAHITFRGANSDGSDDGTVATIQATAAITGIFVFTAAADWVEVEGLVFDASSTATRCISNTVDESNFNIFIRCRFTGATGDGVHVAGTVIPGWQFYDCEFDANGGDGIGTTASNRGNIMLVACSLHDNTTHGIGNPRNVYAFGCLLYDNGGDGINLAAGDSCILIGNTCVLNDGDGIDVTAASKQSIVINNSCTDNGAYGFNLNTNDETDFWDYNHTYNNTSGAVNGTLPGSNNQTGNPVWASITDGSEDFTPSGAPVVDKGLEATE